MPFRKRCVLDGLFGYSPTPQIQVRIFQFGFNFFFCHRCTGEAHPVLVAEDENPTVFFEQSSFNAHYTSTSISYSFASSSAPCDPRQTGWPRSAGTGIGGSVSVTSSIKAGCSFANWKEQRCGELRKEIGILSHSKVASRAVEREIIDCGWLGWLVGLFDGSLCSDSNSIQLKPLHSEMEWVIVTVRYCVFGKWFCWRMLIFSRPCKYTLIFEVIHIWKVDSFTLIFTVVSIRVPPEFSNKLAP